MPDYKKLTEIQKKHMNEDIHDLSRKDIHEAWFREDTVDFWRNKRMLDFISPIAKFYSKNTWVSIGDGRYGLDSIHLKKLYGLNVFPTDISENMLKKSKEMNLINDYGVENAEELSFGDETFDVVFCKESFHHFPRPIIALYEMLRVAREAVILYEPTDSDKARVSGKKYIISALKIMLNKIVNRNHMPYVPNIDDSGNHIYEKDPKNYVYSVSNSEINKIVHGLNLAGMAFFEYNDAYIPGIEFEKATQDSKLFNKVKKDIQRLDEAGARTLTVTIIFKRDFDLILRENLLNAGYTIPPKVENPYV